MKDETFSGHRGQQAGNREYQNEKDICYRLVSVRSSTYIHEGCQVRNKIIVQNFAQKVAMGVAMYVNVNKYFYSHATQREVLLSLIKIT